MCDELVTQCMPPWVLRARFRGDRRPLKTPADAATHRPEVEPGLQPSGYRGQEPCAGAARPRRHFVREHVRGQQPFEDGS